MKAVPANWKCNSDDHNDAKGCSNPECFKFNGGEPTLNWKAWEEKILATVYRRIGKVN